MLNEYLSKQKEQEKAQAPLGTCPASTSEGRESKKLSNQGLQPSVLKLVNPKDDNQECQPTYGPNASNSASFNS